MKLRLSFFNLILVCFFSQYSFSQSSESVTTLFDKVIFYDGYAAASAEPTQVGVVRLRNDLYAKKITDEERNSVKSTLTIDVTIGALCDNYDRLGGVFISLVPKGQPLSDNTKKTIEIGRFITPFMNKNRQPTEVPYTFDLTHLVPMFKDNAMKAYDFWIEFNVFGVPYAANNEVVGCSGRNDVFEGTVKMKTAGSGNVLDTFYLLPLASRDTFNNYNATDVAGTTTKVYQFTLEQDINESYFHLITSNHGANSGGEEYVRRMHYVYLDNSLIESYKPGGKSCEPYRQYNTQANGIYGNRPKTEADWTSWNNWCPGDVIPNRIYKIADLKKGTHEFKLTVPDAQFVGQQGDFPLSLFFYATGINGVLSNEKFEKVSYKLYPNPTQDVIHISSEDQVDTLVLYDMKGSKVMEAKQVNTLNMSKLSSGNYILTIIFSNGVKTKETIVKK
ncbi:peptide-N-glycosidase F-related protein [Myroides odoratus]|uniref:peptide-N-glycosidase F-related protein n=1 Tax=Myroides odoratus TaxID=256 RepID=UPI0039B0D061